MLYEKIAWQTRGTVDVNSEIRVIPDTRVSDRQLEEAILTLARQHKQLPNIDVGVKDGVVIIHGTVDLHPNLSQTQPRLVSKTDPSAAP